MKFYQKQQKQSTTNSIQMRHSTLQHRMDDKTTLLVFRHIFRAVFDDAIKNIDLIRQRDYKNSNLIV